MDFSQQELPLTAYFARGSKERSRVVSSKKGRSAEELQPVAASCESSKRRRSDVQSSTKTPSSGSAGQSKLRRKTLQLPTPATSTRKRGGRLPSPAKTPLTSTDALLPSVEQTAILPQEVDFAELESGPTPSKPHLSHQPAQDAIPLVTPSTDRGRTTKPLCAEVCPGRRLSDREQTGIATPPTLPRRIREPVQDTGRPAARPDYHSHNNHARPRFSVGPDCEDPFYAGENSSVVAQHPTETSKQYSMQSNGRASDGRAIPIPPVSSSQSQYLLRLDATPKRKRSSQRAEPVISYCMQSNGRAYDGRTMPILPVPSSQSQYLLRLDATPKRERCSRRTEPVISPQTQEERELTFSTRHGPTSLSTGGSSERPIDGSAPISHLGCSKRKTRDVYTVDSTPVASPNSSPSGISHSFSTKKASDKLSLKSTSPSRRERVHSPDCKVKTPQRLRCDSIENIPPVHIEDSLTESESESDILHLRMMGKLSAPGRSSRGNSQAVCDSDSLPRGSAECGLGVEEDSATEAESDTEIFHCVAEIGRKRHRSEPSREDTPRRPVVSPLVSPARPRIAPMPSIAGPTRFPAQEGAGSSIPGRGAPSPPTTQSQMPSQSLPSVVRDFIRMFPGDESYPADFPASLRV